MQKQQNLIETIIISLSDDLLFYLVTHPIKMIKIRTK